METEIIQISFDNSKDLEEYKNAAFDDASELLFKLGLSEKPIIKHIKSKSGDPDDYINSVLYFNGTYYIAQFHKFLQTLGGDLESYEENPYIDYLTFKLDFVKWLADYFNLDQVYEVQASLNI